MSRPALRLALPALALLASGCLKNHATFRDWYRNGGYADAMAVPEERSRLFGYLRTPEVVLQPSGGLTTPALSFTATGPGGWETSARYDRPGDGRPAVLEEQRFRAGESSSHTSPRGTYDRRFVTHNGGILDLVPYRVWTARNLAPDEKLGRSFLQPVTVAFFYPFVALRRAPVYVATDVYKTLMLPVAWFHYRGREAEATRRTPSYTSDSAPSAHARAP